jgi:CRAL/TRIO domain
MQIRSFYPHFWHKVDRFGRPVHYELLGELQLPAMLKVCSVERLVKLHTLGWERIKRHVFPACSVSAGRTIFSFVAVIDLKGLKMTSFTKDTRTFIAEIAKIDQVRALLQ